MTLKELERINAMSLDHLFALMDTSPDRWQRVTTTLAFILRHARDSDDNGDDHVANYADGIAENFFDKYAAGLGIDKDTAKLIVEDMEWLAHLLLYEKGAKDWPPELLSRLRRIQNPIQTTDEAAE